MGNRYQNVKINGQIDLFFFIFDHLIYKNLLFWSPIYFTSLNYFDCIETKNYSLFICYNVVSQTLHDSIIKERVADRFDINEM